MTRYCFRCGRDTVWRECICSECKHGPYLSADAPHSGDLYVTRVPWEDGTGSRMEYGANGCRWTPPRLRSDS